MCADMHAFLATMVAPSRPMPIECILAVVRHHYGLEARVTRLTGERDENFRLTADDGAEYVLKIANPAESPAETDLKLPQKVSKSHQSLTMIALGSRNSRSP
jgi:Ser/Thr protein kinase RdoA (MazF antagonist)